MASQIPQPQRIRLNCAAVAEQSPQRSVVRFHMAISSWLRGGPVQLRRANLCLMFQVNCPGCFTHALPALLELHAQFAGHKDVTVFAVATAFEDFELNTEGGLRALLKDGIVGGATLRHLQEWQGKDCYDLPLSFPVGWDRVEPTPQDAGAVRTKAEALLDTLSRLGRLGVGKEDLDVEKRKMVVEGLEGMIKSRPYSAEMFDANVLRGTPSWILFREDASIYDEWLGSRPVASIADMVHNVLNE